MSQTNVDIIQSAYQLLGVVGEAQSVSAEQGDIGLTALNQLMESLAVEDINLGYFAQTSTTDTCPIPAWAERGVISLLAQELAGIYPSAQITARIADDEKNGVNVIKRAFMNQKLNGMDTSYLGLGAGWGGLRGRRWNITDG